MRKLILLFFALIPNCLFGQSTYNYNNYSMVCAESGLRARESPSLNSKVIKVYPYGSVIMISGRSENKEIINGITDYWYSTWDYSEVGRVWLFGGYLTNIIESKPLVGIWKNEDSSASMSDVPWIFELNGNFRNQVPESDVGIWGTYVFNNNNLTLIYEVTNWELQKMEHRRDNARVEFINTNRIKIIFKDKQMTLSRWVNNW